MVTCSRILRTLPEKITSQSLVELSGEVGDSLNIEITATDSAGNAFSQNFTLNFGELTLDANSFEENIENIAVATIILGNENLANWEITLEGSDARFFTINQENQIEFIGTADYESKPSYELIIKATNNWIHYRIMP